MNNSSTSEGPYQCTGVTQDQLAYFKSISFWISGVSQLIICLIGICINLIAIPVLKSKALYKSTFNRLLIVLALIDMTYLILALAECIRQEMDVSLTPHLITFVYFLYPLHHITLCFSIFMTTCKAAYLASNLFCFCSGFSPSGKSILIFNIFNTRGQKCSFRKMPLIR